MAKPDVLAVTFRVAAQRKNQGAFTVPSEVLAMLGLDVGDDVVVEVQTASGQYGPVAKTLKSDRQPSPVGEMREWMAPGEVIIVTVRRAG